MWAFRGARIRGGRGVSYEPFDTKIPRTGDTLGQGPTELIVREKEALLFFATHGNTNSWAKRWKSWLMRGTPDGKTLG